MRKMLLSAGALVAATFAVTPATAIVIDFDDFANTYASGPVYVEDGYKLTVSICGATASCFKAVDPTLSIDGTGTSVVRGGGATTITVQRENGTAFEFGSMDFGKLKVETSQPWTHSSRFDFTFTLEDASTIVKSFTFLHNNPNPITTITTPVWDDVGAITKFTFRQVSGGGQFDNIVLNDIAAAVPEPGTWAMMLGGFGLLGGAMRRRRAVAQFA